MLSQVTPNKRAGPPQTSHQNACAKLPPVWGCSTQLLGGTGRSDHRYLEECTSVFHQRDIDGAAITVQRSRTKSCIVTRSGTQPGRCRFF